jgi:hypothetical protein
MSLGLVGEIVRRRSVLHLCFLFFYALALLLILSETRYLIPVLPLLALFVIEGARLIAGRSGPKQARLGVCLALLVLICVNPYWRNGYSFGRALRARLDAARGTAVIYPEHESFLDLVRRNRPNLSTADVVGTMHPEVLRYFVPRDVAVRTLPLMVDVDRSYREIRNAGMTYVYCDKTVSIFWMHIDPVIRTYAQNFQLMFDNPAAAIYRVVP